MSSRRLLFLSFLSVLTLLAAAAVPARAQGESLGWQEHFDHSPLGWVDPFDHGAAKLARVYSVGHEGPLSFLHARHDCSVDSHPPAMHYGMAFVHDPLPLERVRALRWRWRVRQHPRLEPDDDAWLDMAAGVYVVMRTPSLFKGGKGFKFGWLAKPGRPGTYQHGLLQVPMRHDAAGADWREESVDLCALYRNEYGRCEGEHVLYVGVVTDADGTKSASEADYAEFALVVGP